MTFKKHEWVNGNHQKINSGHRTFDAQVGGIAPGNVIDDVEFGWYIRSWWDEGEGLADPIPRAPGHLFEFDISSFLQGNNRLPRYIYEAVKKEAQERTNSVILYKFRHWRDGEEIVHGYILTDAEHNHLMDWITGPTYKSFDVIKEVAGYVCNIESLPLYFDE